jgi:hypothetical protein
MLRAAKAIEERLAASDRLAYRIRFIDADGEVSFAPPSEAGGVVPIRRPQPRAHLDFARLLDRVGHVLARDSASLGLPSGAARHVIFLTDTAPWADAVSAERFELLRQVASISWILLEPIDDLLSDAFRTPALLALVFKNPDDAVAELEQALYMSADGGPTPVLDVTAEAVT